MRMIRRIIVGVLSAALLGLALVGWQVYVTSKRAQRAQAAIRTGMRCNEALNAIQPFADEVAHEEDVRVCQSVGPRAYSGFSPTFSSPVGLTFTFEVKFDQEGRVQEVSPIGGW